MSNSWGHTLQRLTPEQLAANAHMAAVHAAEPWAKDGGCRCGKCQIGRCHQPATHLTAYNYVTGRAGRVSWAAKEVCDDHAAKFRAKHNLPEPEVAVAPKHALERLLTGEAATNGQ